jgi:hypothetical protein
MRTHTATQSYAGRMRAERAYKAHVKATKAARTAAARGARIRADIEARRTTAPDDLLAEAVAEDIQLAAAWARHREN